MKKNAKYRVALPPDRVETLRALARQLSYARGAEITWCDLLRKGMELVITAEKESESHA